MSRRPDARTLLFDRIRTTSAKFVHVRGVPYAVSIDKSSDSSEADCVALTLEVPPFGRFRAAINTVSPINRDAGVDSRVRVAILPTVYTEKPATSFGECLGYDYASIEATQKVVYTPVAREDLEEMLVTKMREAIRAEVWGELYARDHLGIDQIHSRQAGRGVPQGCKNRDGAIKLYYPTDSLAELMLFKFSHE